MNNAERILTYIKDLKDSMLEDYAELYAEESD